MSDSGKQIGDCKHAKNPAWCVECLRQAVVELTASKAKSDLAFLIMMRCGWYPQRTLTGWIVMDYCGGYNTPFRIKCDQQWPDPFSALVEANEWYKATWMGNHNDLG